MPTTLHQGLVWAFADDPALGFDLLREVFDVDLPPLHTIQNRRTELDRFVPCFGDTSELRPDIALSAELVEPTRSMRGVALIIEVQRKPSSVKRWRIWVYWSLLAERLKRSTAVMMVALDDRTSRWARRLGDMKLPPHAHLLVLDRQNMPRIIDLQDARCRPAKMLLSALLHRDMEVLTLAMKVVLELTDDRRWRYASCLLAATPESRRNELKEGLTVEERYELTDIERNSIAYHDGLRLGRLEGIIEGQGKGKREGIIEGKREGIIELVLTVLELRGLELDEAGALRIRSCTDLDQLAQWATRAKHATNARELFTE